MINKDVIIQQLPDFYKDDQFINDLFNAIGIKLDDIYADLDEIDQQRFFDKLTILLRDTEKLLKITPVDDLAVRRSSVEAKWKGVGKCDLVLIQAVCNSWKNGEVDVSFVNGKIKLTFIGALGIPNDLNSLENAIDEIKPAHLAFYTAFKWLLKKDINNVMTKSQMQTIQKSNFARGSY